MLYMPLILLDSLTGQIHTHIVSLASGISFQEDHQSSQCVDRLEISIGVLSYHSHEHSVWHSQPCGCYHSEMHAHLVCRKFQPQL